LQVEGDQIDIEELWAAQKLFEAYSEGVGGKAFNGDPIPGWHELKSDKVKYGWVCAWRAARDIFEL